MKSYALAVAMAMLFAAVYAFQNTGEILVKFLVWERSMPQGLWEVLLFAAGGVLMWLVSFFAMMENRGKYSKQLKEKDKRIKELDSERASLMSALKSSGARDTVIPKIEEVDKETDEQ
ncbi:MAG: LapA family protein [Synergistota bacterium]|nr:LapA family protein [Synergistota bacterium]